MLRFFFLSIFICISLLHAKEIELFASKIDSNGTTVNATGDVAVIYEDSYMRADRLVYHKELGRLELFGNINILKGGLYYLAGDYAKIHVDDQKNVIEPFYLKDNSSRIWITSESACDTQNVFSLESSILSSCNPSDPEWTIRFSSGDYSQESQWMQMFNARIYIGEVPIFYLPYFAFPMDKTRRTGLLIPSFGMSSEEGFIFAQPLYIAPSDNWDLEITPQVRSKRGQGIYNTFRFVDTAYSKGEFTFGYFKENDDYANGLNIIDKEYFGYELNYENTKLFSQKLGKNIQDGLYIDLNIYDNTEYLEQKAVSGKSETTTSTATSNLNYFINSDEHYIGAYGRYYVDTNQSSNSNKLQQLPKAHYHKYLDAFLYDKVTYSFDYKWTNHYRREGAGAVEHEFTVPLSFHTSLFNRYLNFSFTENMYLSQIYFNSDQGIYEDGYYGSGYHQISLFTDLVKPYTNYNHSLKFEVSHLWNGFESESGYYKTYKSELTNSGCNQGDPCEFASLSLLEEQTDIELTQYLHQKNGEQILYDRLKQSVTYDTNSTYDGRSRNYYFTDLENEVRLNVTNEFTLSNTTYYSHYQNKVTKTSNSISYNDVAFKASLTYFYEDSTSQSNYLTNDLKYRFNNKYDVFTNLKYDFKNDETTTWKVGWNMLEDCWKYTISYEDSIRTGTSIRDKVVMLQVELIPIGGYDYEYKWSNQEK